MSNLIISRFMKGFNPHFPICCQKNLRLIIKLVKKKKVSPLVKSVRGNIRCVTCSSSTPWWPAAFEMTSLESISWIADQKNAISELLHQKLVNLLTRCIQVPFPPCGSIFLYISLKYFYPWLDWALILYFIRDQFSGKLCPKCAKKRVLTPLIEDFQL